MNTKQQEDRMKKELEKASKEYCIAMHRTYGGVFSQYNSNREAIEVGNNTTVRAGYGTDNYDYFRSHEEIPKSIKGRIDLCMQVYEYEPVVHNLIDTMEDFTVQGIRITHANKKVAKFFKAWAKKVDFQGVSGRIANTLYRAANVPVKITTGKIPTAKLSEWKSKGKKEFDSVEYGTREIPIHYEILHPMQVEVMDEFHSVTGKKRYCQKLSASTTKDLLSKRNSPELSSLPSSLFFNLQKNNGQVPLDPAKFEILFYKKDDWNDFALPFSSAILGSLSLMEKMRLSDRSALDGAINQVRLWTLGVFEPFILPPSPTSIQKLRNLLSNVGNGNIDLIWGPELKFTETTTQVHQFLGSDKYTQVNAEINGGLGLPSVMSGSASSDKGGHTSTSIAMRTLIERLEYGRRIIVAFWEEQFRRVCQAIGNCEGIWSTLPKVTFDYKVLSDERAEIELLLKLYDRNLVSDETVQELSRRDPELELARIQKETKERLENTRPEKATPFHNPRWEDDFNKILLQQGVVTPSELGLELHERKEGEETFMELSHENDKELEKYKPNTGQEGGNGRPPGSKDKQKRKQKTVKEKSGSVASFGNLFIWATKAQEEVKKIAVPLVLQATGKKNIRSLTDGEYLQYDHLLFSVLSNLEPFSTVTDESVYSILENETPGHNDTLAIAKVMEAYFENKTGKKPNVEERRQIQAMAYAVCNTPEEGEDEE